VQFVFLKLTLQMMADKVSDYQCHTVLPMSVYVCLSMNFNRQINTY